MINNLLGILILLILISCKNKEPKTITNQTLKTVAQPDSRGLIVLKSIVAKENSTEKTTSIKLVDTDIIDDLIFIRDLFPIEEIDSVEFYGAHRKNSIDAKKIPDNSLIIVYFNHRRLARNQIKLMETEWNYNFKELQEVFEKGGIVFELDKQACIYIMNTCDERANAIEKIDSIFKKELHQNSYDYNRIITKCGTVSFNRSVN